MISKTGIDFSEVSRTQELASRESAQAQRTRTENKQRLENRADTQRQTAIKQSNDDVQLRRRETKTLENLQKSLTSEAAASAERNREARENVARSNNSQHNATSVARQGALETGEQVLGTTVNVSA